MVKGSLSAVSKSNLRANIHFAACTKLFKIDPRVLMEVDCWKNKKNKKVCRKMLEFTAFKAFELVVE